MKGGRDQGRDRRDGGGGGGLDLASRGRFSDFKVIVSGLPTSASWQDLKDHFKKTCDGVLRTDVDKQGLGIVEFKTRQDLDDGLKLDDSEFINKFSDGTRISVLKPDDYHDSKRGKSRSRSPRNRSRSRSRDSRNRYSNSRSRSPKNKRSPSRSNSRNRDDKKDGPIGDKAEAIIE